MYKWLILPMMLTLARTASGDDQLVSPVALATRAALADAKTRTQQEAYQTIYFSLYEQPPETREELRTSFWFHCNLLSRSGKIKRAREVNPTLFAVVCEWYQWDRSLFGILVTESQEPYFHFQIDIQDSYDVVRDQYGRESKVPVKGKRIFYPGPWVDYAAYAELQKLTGHTAPIWRADQFIHATGIQADRGKAGYYDWLGLGKKEGDFHALCGVDTVLAKKLQKEMAGVVGRSLVTHNNRSMTRFDAITGPFWFTQDYKNSKGLRNTLRYINNKTEPPQGDASEQIGTLPNGLHAYWLQNDKGERQDSAPDFIASDSQSHNTDRRVHSAMSCVRCHTQGWQPIDEWSREVFQGRKQLVNPSTEIKLAERLELLYMSDLKEQIVEDQARFARKVKEANGLTPVANAKAYANVWARYEEDMTLEDVVRELGTTKEQLTQALLNSSPLLADFGDGSKDRRPILDLVVVSIIPNPDKPKVEGAKKPREDKIRREHFEELIPYMYAALGYQIKPPPDKGPAK